VPAEEFTFGFLKPPHDDVVAAAAFVEACFARSSWPWRLAHRGLSRERLALLTARGWSRRRDPTPGMALSIPSSTPPPPSDLTIEPVHTPTDLLAYREAAFRGFGHPVAAAHIFLGERLLTSPQVRMYAGLADGRVVATSMLVATNAVAGIYWVATLEQARGRGLGAALTWAAVAGGRALGCTIANLQASRLGFPVYARMGFEHILDYEFLHPPEP
jgi:GNAT superfamily N-acetyltransferase